MPTVRLDEFGKDMGVVHEAVVTGRKVGAGTEFWSRLAHDEELFRTVADTVLGRVGMTDAEMAALEILGPGKVLGFKPVHSAWGMDLPDTEPAMPFTEDILRECAEANASGKANWRFSYVTGKDLRSQREFIGWDRKKQPCFDPDWSWWLDKEQDGWAKTAVTPGYRLYDFTKRYSNLTWSTQNQQIADDLGDQFERAEEQAVAEICFSTFKLNNGERLLPNWYHWGKLQSASGRHACVGYFDRYGFRVCSRWDDDPNDNLGVVVSRNFFLYLFQASLVDFIHPPSMRPMVSTSTSSVVYFLMSIIFKSFSKRINTLRKLISTLIFSSVGSF